MMTKAITNARLLDCKGEDPQENVSLIIEGGVIKDIQLSGRASIPEGGEVYDADGDTVMPGLIDAHDHFAVTTNDLGAVLHEPPLFTAVKIQKQLEKILDAGFTTVRDAGGGHWSIRHAVRENMIRGPRLLICGPMISITGGHGDFNLRGEMSFPPKNQFIKLMRLCDGEEDYRKAAREQFQLWADHLKICVTGGCASPNDEPWQIHMTENEIKAITQEASMHGTYVMAHSLNDKGNKRAVKCGVKTVEHACFLSDETAKLMKEMGAAVISTFAVVNWAERYGEEEGAAEWFLRKLENPGCSPEGLSLMEGMIQASKVALKHGVPVGSGADYFGTMCGGEVLNLKLLVDLVGMTPYQALKTATAVNADILGLGNLGTIDVGKIADIIVVKGKPDEDINSITDSKNILLVMREGQVYKDFLS